MPQLIFGYGETYTEDGATASEHTRRQFNGVRSRSRAQWTRALQRTYTLTYTVSDAAGNAATPLTRTVTVTNRAPTSLTLSNQSVEWKAGLPARLWVTLRPPIRMMPPVPVPTPIRW